MKRRRAIQEKEEKDKAEEKVEKAIQKEEKEEEVEEEDKKGELSNRKSTEHDKLYMQGHLIVL